MDEQTQEQAVTLGTQLGAAGIAVLAMTILHALGLVIILRAMGVSPQRMIKREMNSRSMLLIGGFGTALFALHLIEIALFAVFYRVIDALETTEEALFFSASAYATLGQPTEAFPQEWRLMIAVEAVIGFVLISWSAAFIVSVVNGLRETSDD